MQVLHRPGVGRNIVAVVIIIMLVGVAAVAYFSAGSR